MRRSNIIIEVKYLNTPRPNDGDDDSENVEPIRSQRWMMMVMMLMCFDGVMCSSVNGGHAWPPRGEHASEQYDDAAIFCPPVPSKTAGQTDGIVPTITYACLRIDRGKPMSTTN